MSVEVIKKWYVGRQGRVLVRCHCGTVKEVHLGNASRMKSCGCDKGKAISEARTTHGKTGTGIYNLWKGMIQRCTNPNSEHYADYGGRGILPSDEWRSFENFYADMGDPPEGKTLERRDNDKGYCRGNCYWATRVEQANNKRRNVKVTHNGETKTIAQWCKVRGLNYSTVMSRIHQLNWPVELALEL